MVDQFRLHGLEETLSHGVVQAITFSTYTLQHRQLYL